MIALKQAIRPIGLGPALWSNARALNRPKA
jgi:hypothetical protein